MANAICFLSVDRSKGQIAINTIRARLIAFVSNGAIFDSYNHCYVNPFVRGWPPPADSGFRQPWFAVLRLRDSSQNGIRWPAFLTGIRRYMVAVFVIAYGRSESTAPVPAKWHRQPADRQAARWILIAL